jgi:toxin ParE1/3/4
VKLRRVEFAPEARDDLLALYDWISVKASPQIALGYIERVEAYCNDFDFASERGLARDDIRKGLRIIGFERRLTIAFIVSDTTVTILRLFYGGQNWEGDLLP